MTIKEIIEGLKFTVDMFLFDTSTGETFTEPRNDMDKTTIDACKGAIKLLEQQPCEDCISREDLKRKFQEEHDLYVNAYGGFSNLPVKEKARVDEITSCIAEVVNMPSVYSKPKTEHWIPVSERLPKIAGVYRVTRYYPNNVMNPSYIVDACAFDGSNTWYDDNRINLERAYADNVIAWQEDPEPYKP